MPRVCIHLDQATESDWDYCKSFSGKGIEYALICLRCREAPETIEASLRSVSPGRFNQIESDGCWESDKSGIHGLPETLERPGGVSFRHEDVPLDIPVTATVVDLKPVPSSLNGECLALFTNGDLIRIGPSRGSIPLLNALSGSVALSPGLSLHVSPDGDMAAVVEARGQHGVVFDLASGRPTMVLDRGNYRPEHTDFPVAFFEMSGQLRLVHGTVWNRLDVSDPRTGSNLTGRTLAPVKGTERPAHFLDYFHGSLTVSPNVQRIIDNGWVWGPAGIVVSWSLRRWVQENPWESEDGPSRRGMCMRHYFWEGPLCWIDDEMLAVWGYGNDDYNLVPAALLVNAESGQLVRWFAGPEGRFEYDRYLYSTSVESGTSVWDIENGERILHEKAFCPTCYHRGARRFITVMTGSGLRLTRLVEG
jgi:hypothetical protein